jgi:hypothetical protein
MFKRVIIYIGNYLKDFIVSYLSLFKIPKIQSQLFELLSKTEQIIV